VPAGPPYVAVVGAAEPTDTQARAAEAGGEGLARAGAVIINGGGGRVMAAVSRGASQAGGLVVGVLPGADRRQANEFVSVSWPPALASCAKG
jgi:uncharacterized protein (TIGR00725 family)